MKGASIMRTKIVATFAALALFATALVSAGAYWTASPGPDPDRCQGWYESGSPYFDRYNCEWHGAPLETPEPDPTPQPRR